MHRPPNKPFVAVTWRDPQGARGPFSEHEVPHAPIEITTYGWLIRRDDQGVSLASEYCADNSYREYTFVLTELILETVEIAVKKARIRRTKEKGCESAHGLG